MNSQSEQDLTIARIWAILWSGRWLIAAFVAVAVAWAILHLFVTPYTYRVDALLQIQPESNSPLQGLTSNLSSITGKHSSPAQAEIPIIKSRAVLRETVDKLQLNISAGPTHFPIIGGAIASHRAAARPASRAVDPSKGSWLAHYAWRPVHISLNRLEVPGRLKGKTLTLRALGAGQYIVYGPKHNRLVRGQVGKQAVGQTPRGEPVRLFVSRLVVSSPPTDFHLSRSRWLGSVQGLQAGLTVSEQGQDSGILQIALSGHNPRRITKIVNSVAQNYQRKNAESRSKKAKQSLKFLDKKLPQIKSDLNAAEAKLAAYRKKHQAVNLTAEGQALLQQASTLQDKTSKLKLKITQLKQSYTAKHPTVQAAREQLQQLQQENNKLESKIGTLPESQKHILRLRRDMEVNTKLYSAMLNRAQQLRVIKAGTVGNVRIIDKAVLPNGAVSPKPGFVLMVAVMLGFILGASVLMVKIALRRGVDDPKEIENRLGIPVYAVVPFSNWLARHSGRSRRHGREPILARDHSDDVSVEALRSLRTSLYFAQMEAQGSTILVTGPSPGVGKSFISSNLAYLLADAGKTVVVVDADMRRGRLHQFLDNQREPGLSQVLTGQVELDEALRPLDETGVRILTSGRIPPNPSELLMREEFASLMGRLKEQFDVVLIDAPPILAVTDAAVIAGSMSGMVTFLVTRAGAHPMAEIEEAVNRMKRNDLKISGAVFNGYRQKHADYAGGYSYQQYQYKAAN